MTYKIEKTENGVTFKEYLHGVYTEIEFTESRVKVKTEETKFNPIKGNIGYYKFKKELEKKIKEHGRF